MTNSERMGCSQAGNEVLRGPKTPIEWGDFIQKSLISGASGLGSASTATAFSFIFNGLQVREALWAGGERVPSRCLQGERTEARRSERFGPIFVTIMPTEVRVCSF